MIRRASLLLAASVLAACASTSKPMPQIAVDRMRVQPAVTIIQLDERDAGSLARVMQSNSVRHIQATYKIVAPSGGRRLAAAQLDQVPAAQRDQVSMSEGGTAPLHVEVTRLKARVEACPDWSRRSDDDFSNRPSSNFGCSDAANLAAQVDNPADLLAGRGRVAAPAARLAAAVADLAAGRIKPLKAAPTPAQGGPISDDLQP